jgi:hypothetical protein
MRLDTGLAVRITVAHVVRLRTDPSSAVFHPFQGGCYGVGDLVDDNPPVIGPRFDCSIPTDSCEGGGMDLMDNYMTYYRE